MACDRENAINLDGELLLDRTVTFSLVPKAIRFFYPKGETWGQAVGRAAAVSG